MLSILLVGPSDAELRNAALAIEGSSIVHCAADLDEAARMLESGAIEPVEIVVLPESRGGRTSDASLDALRRLAPLVRVWRVLGTWCEGEARSGRPPRGCLTTYWHQWPARFGRALRLASRGEAPDWALPLTATADERIAADALALGALRGSGTIVVVAPRAQAASALVDLCRRAGCDTLLATEDGRFRVDGAKAVVWDATVERIVDPRAVAELRACAPGARVVAVVGFPRAEDVEAAQRAGVDAVVSKPFLAGDLLWHLEGAVGAVA
jgi:CheY-like chemotaxis protein